VGLRRAQTLLVRFGDPELIAEVGGEAVRHRLAKTSRVARQPRQFGSRSCNGPASAGRRIYARSKSHGEPYAGSPDRHSCGLGCGGLNCG